jgi:DNA repair photolyase
MKITEVKCKNALVKSKIEGMDYALNPYIGCQHACVYCYAEFMKKYTNHKEEWGEFVDVKTNIADRLREQVKKTKPGVVMVGTVTDAYQPSEEKYQLTRKCLEVLRDIDILKKIKDREVGFTITCPDPDVEKLFEPGASALVRRFEALKKLQENGIPTFAFVGPILPFFSDSVGSLKLLFERLQKMKIDEIYLDKMNYLKGKRRKICSLLEKQFPCALRLYEDAAAREEKYTEWLKSNLTSALSGFSFESKVLF